MALAVAALVPLEDPPGPRIASDDTLAPAVVASESSAAMDPISDIGKPAGARENRRAAGLFQVYRIK